MIEVKLHVESEAPDTLTYIDCPECGSRNKLMVVPLEDGGYFYKCLRASCPTFGSLYSTEAASRRGEVRDKPVRATYPSWRTLDLVPLSPFEYGYFDAFGLDETQADHLCRGLLGTRLVFPIYDMYGGDAGYVARQLRIDEGTGPKALIRPRFADGPLMSWYPGDGYDAEKPLVLVEDQISAVRLSEHFPTVALLGTTIPNEGISELGAVPRDCVVVALDEDATKQGIQLARRLGQYVMPLSRDVKDMTDSEFDRLRSALREYPKERR